MKDMDPWIYGSAARAAAAAAAGAAAFAAAVLIYGVIEGVGNEDYSYVIKYIQQQQKQQHQQ